MGPSYKFSTRYLWAFSARHSTSNKVANQPTVLGIPSCQKSGCQVRFSSMRPLEMVMLPRGWPNKD